MDCAYLVFGCEIPSKELPNVLGEIPYVLEEFYKDHDIESIEDVDDESSKLVRWFLDKHLGYLIVDKNEGYTLMTIKDDYYLVLSYTVILGNKGPKHVQIPSYLEVKKFLWFIQDTRLDLVYTALLIPA